MLIPCDKGGHNANGFYWDGPYKTSEEASEACRRRFPGQVVTMVEIRAHWDRWDQDQRWGWQTPKEQEQRRMRARARALGHGKDRSDG
jgi:hypothetical protein